MSECEYRCPTCGGSVPPLGETCPICGSALTTTIVHTNERESIFPEPILVRHAEDEPAIPMDPTAHMKENTAPTISAGVYGENGVTAPKTSTGGYTEAEDTPTIPEPKIIDLSERTKKTPAEDAGTRYAQQESTDPMPMNITSTPLRYVVVGGGVAGLNAAEAIREADPAGHITLVCGEPVPPYRRTALSRELSACATREGLALRTPDQYREARIEVLCDATVTDIDPVAQTVRTVAEVLPYDRLVLAVGSTPLLPPISGLSLAGVLTLRELSDGRALLRRLPYLERVAILGGGLLGIEMALTLAKEGCLVTIVESAPTLLSGILHQSTANELARTLTEAGITLRLGVRCTHIQGRDRVIGIVTEDGRSSPCDGVLVCCGTEPRTALSRLLGLPCERGIPANEYLATPIPNIWACGDCVATTLPAGVRHNWQFAVESGKAAGKNAAGTKEVFAPRMTPVVLPVFDQVLCAVGDCGQHQDTTYHIVSYQTAGGRDFAEFFFRADRLVGASLLADAPDVAALVDAVDEGVSLADFFATHAFRAQGSTVLA